MLLDLAKFSFHKIYSNPLLFLEMIDASLEKQQTLDA
jgi:hypothetical protein